MVTLSVNLFEFKQGMNRATRRLIKRTPKGAMSAGVLLLNLANEVAPEDTGELVDSGKVSVEKGTASVFYTAEYAGAVHKMSGVNWTKAGTIDQWLERTASKTEVKTALLRAYISGMSQGVIG